MGRGSENTKARGGVQAASTTAAVPRHGKTAPTDQWVRIDGVEYDVSAFMRKHPGGSVLKFALANEGADATDLFKAFHLRSKKAALVLKTLPRRAPQFEVQPGQTPSADDAEGRMLKDFAAFEQQLHADGFFETSPVHVALRVAELVAIFLLGLYLFSLRTPLAIAAGVLVHGLFGGRSGWLQHESGHGSLVQSLPLGKAIQDAFIGFGLGVTGSLWCEMHNKHHAATQKVNHDLDIDTTPFVAFYDTAVEKSKHKVGIPRLWARLQAFTFLPVTSGVLVMAFWLSYLHPRRVLRKRLLGSGFWMLASHVGRTLLFQQATGWESTFWSYMVGFWACMWVSGVYLFGHFSLSHTHMDIVEEDVHKSWLRAALDHTVDISPGHPGVDWIMGYLNCQVVHHLWPQMPQFRQPEVSRRLTVFCDEHDLHYHKMTYLEAWAATLGNLHTVGKHYADDEQRSAKKID